MKQKYIYVPAGGLTGILAALLIEKNIEIFFPLIELFIPDSTFANAGFGLLALVFIFAYAFSFFQIAIFIIASLIELLIGYLIERRKNA